MLNHEPQFQSQDLASDHMQPPAPEGTKRPQGNGTPVDHESLVGLIGEDVGLHLRLFNVFHSTTPATFEEFREMHKQRACQDVGMMAHKLRSSALSICASELADVCQALETAARAEAWDQIDLMVPLLEEQIGLVQNYIEDFADAGQGMADQPQARANDPRVLVIDDDLATLELASIQLTQLGIARVLAKSCVDSAIALLELDGSNVDIIICDLNMPGRDGLEFIRLIANMKYQGGLLLVSGENDSILTMASKLAKEHGLQILGAAAKPLTHGKLDTFLGRFIPRTTPQRQRRVEVEEPLCREDLVEAIASGQIVAHFQPKIDVAQRSVAGVEALARWQHPTRGLIPPVAFLPIVEQFNLMDDLTNCMLEQGMRCAANLQADGQALNVSVNISTSTLVDLAWPDYAADLAARCGVTADMITLEVTETGMVADATAALEVLTRLRLRGFMLSVDDFGTGYASMEQLLLAPFTELKIDRSFVRGAMTDPAADAILESSAALARRLGMRVVAEGVETREELAMVARYGCAVVQGFFFARPMAYADLRGWLQNWSADAVDQRQGAKIAV